MHSVPRSVGAETDVKTPSSSSHTAAWQPSPFGPTWVISGRATTAMRPPIGSSLNWERGAETDNSGGPIERDAQLVRDLLVRSALRYQPQHLPLPRRPAVLTLKQLAKVLGCGSPSRLSLHSGKGQSVCVVPGTRVAREFSTPTDSRIPARAAATAAADSCRPTVASDSDT